MTEAINRLNILLARWPEDRLVSHMFIFNTYAQYYLTNKETPADDAARALVIALQKEATDITTRWYTKPKREHPLLLPQVNEWWDNLAIAAYEHESVRLVVDIMLQAIDRLW